MSITKTYTPKLTRRELDVLEFCFRFTKLRGKTPTLSDIGEEFRMSRSAAGYFVTRLIQKSVVKRGPEKEMIFLKNPEEIREEFIGRTTAFKTV